MEHAVEMHQLLSAARDVSFSNIITGDESWIYLQNAPEQMWLEENAPRPTFPRRDIAAQKVMIIVFFSGERLLHVSYLPPKETLNSDTYIKYGLESLKRALESLVPRPPLPWFLHIDNAPCHRSVKTKIWLATNGFLTMDHPPYSPDLAPCDFWFFGALKHELKGSTYPSPEKLMNAIVTIATKLADGKMKGVYEEWIHRCKTVMSDGDYFEHTE
jgi:hypothetical protein